MTDTTWGAAENKGLVIAWSSDGADKRYIVWERVPKKVPDELGGRLLLIDATWEQVGEFVEAFE